MVLNWLVNVTCSKILSFLFCILATKTQLRYFLLNIQHKWSLARVRPTSSTHEVRHPRVMTFELCQPIVWASDLQPKSSASKPFSIHLYKLLMSVWESCLSRCLPTVPLGRYKSQEPEIRIENKWHTHLPAWPVNCSCLQCCVVLTLFC